MHVVHVDVLGEDLGARGGGGAPLQKGGGTRGGRASELAATKHSPKTHFYNTSASHTLRPLLSAASSLLTSVPEIPAASAIGVASADSSSLPGMGSSDVPPCPRLLYTTLRYPRLRAASVKS